MKSSAIALIVVAVFLGGCGRKFVGGSSTSYGNTDLRTTTEVQTQRDPDGHLLFVIAWAARNGGGRSIVSDRNLLVSIHDRPVHPSLDRRAIYALQTDYSLNEISLSDDQITALFKEMDDPGFHPSHSKLWQKAIAPHLIRVEEQNANNQPPN